MSTMNFGADGLDFRAQSLLETSLPIDLTDETSVLGFEIGGTEPVGTDRRVIFEVDGELFYFKQGALKSFPYAKTFDDVINYGSTARELGEVSNIPQWIGKKIFPIIALDAPKTSPVMPSINLKIKVNSYNDIYRREILSPIYKLKLTGERGKIISCVANPVVTGRASCVVYIRLKNNGVWGDWLSPSAVNNSYATEVQFKAVQITTTLNGTDSAKVDGVKLDYTTDWAKVSESPAEIKLSPQTSDVDLKKCEVIVRHGELIDAEISARAIYSTRVESREASLGTGDGTSKIFYLPNSNVDQDSLEVQVGGQNFCGFFFDTASSHVQLTAASGTAVTASYEYSSPASDVTLTKISTEREGDHYVSRFYGEIELEGCRTAAAVVTLTRQKGTITDKNLGAGTGETQRFFLPHKAQNLTCTGDYSFDEERQMLTVKTTGNLFISYDWIGDLPEVFDIVAAFGG